MSRDFNVSDLPHKLVKCRFCDQSVELGVLPLHEHLCQMAIENKNSKQQSKQQSNKVHTTRSENLT